jgi:hypothetical protein
MITRVKRARLVVITVVVYQRLNRQHRRADEARVDVEITN